MKRAQDSGENYRIGPFPLPPYIRLEGYAVQCDDTGEFEVGNVVKAKFTFRAQT